MSSFTVGKLCFVSLVRVLFGAAAASRLPRMRPEGRGSPIDFRAFPLGLSIIFRSFASK